MRLFSSLLLLTAAAAAPAPLRARATARSTRGMPLANARPLNNLKPKVQVGNHHMNLVQGEQHLKPARAHLLPKASPLSAAKSRTAVSVQEGKLFKTPPEIFKAMAGAAEGKAKLATKDTLLMGFLAGAYVSMGGTVQMMVGSGLQGLRATSPGLATLIQSGVFPVGLMLVVLAGSELWTGNCAVMPAGATQDKCTWKEVWRNWGLAFVGNFIGTLSFAYFLVHEAGLTSAPHVQKWLATVAATKTGLTFKQAFLRAIGANWMVCLAVMMITSAMSVPGKMMAAWMPIMAFSAIGFEHSVANMFTIPLAHMTQSASLNEFMPLFKMFLKKNLLPVTLGNLVGGLTFVGLLYNRLLINPKKYTDN
mmetsp:Transcript_19715/g.35182  ORF Transcript_19715/g.35182 Transcript_19715/m.35182 type:complete len:364 (-) Transcript_19715:74-1165(-)|eukprot:CAMPEP_0197515954 /NCGR_PEP_ID=MMETSP1318-20131121/901_1 /TAXON_ID=552666 /ORGANISM="Partenskyella glossopodia, Strain RCC365" /LENGTH=363 /DNA_ID=CAMNT_0043064439 /DNA_START=55 /DNA_END=1146 /DNA_ORIENTATION=-